MRDVGVSEGGLGAMNRGGGLTIDESLRMPRWECATAR